MRLPLQMSRPFSAQYRQIALCTNRGNVAGKAGLNWRASMFGREQTENASASARPVAALAVGMVGAQPPQDPGSVQEIMDQGVDRHERRADFEPQRPSPAGAQQQGRQRHRQDLVRDAVDVAQRADDGLATGGKPIRRLGIHRTQLPINPADEIVIGDIPHEQEQAVRHLVEAAVAERVAGQGAGVDVAGLGARARTLYGTGSRRTASTRRASGTMGFATTLRRSPTSGRCRGAPCTQRRPNPKCLESSAPRSANQTGQECHGL